MGDVEVRHFFVSQRVVMLFTVIIFLFLRGKIKKIFSFSLSFVDYCYNLLFSFPKTFPVMFNPF